MARSRAADGQQAVHAALRAALLTGSDVIVPAAVLAEQYRGGGHDQIVDSYLGRETGIGVADTDQRLARRVGNILARAGRGSQDHVDATAAAVAVSNGGGVILTGDLHDLTALSDGLPGLVVESIS